MFSMDLLNFYNTLRGAHATHVMKTAPSRFPACFVHIERKSVLDYLLSAPAQKKFLFSRLHMLLLKTHFSFPFAVTRAHKKHKAFETR